MRAMSMGELRNYIEIIECEIIEEEEITAMTKGVIYEKKVIGIQELNKIPRVANIYYSDKDLLDCHLLNL